VNLARRGHQIGARPHHLPERRGQRAKALDGGAADEFDHVWGPGRRGRGRAAAPGCIERGGTARASRLGVDPSLLQVVIEDGVGRLEERGWRGLADSRWVMVDKGLWR
jgi:hypothetical protein